jgi:hypothetical protein
MAIWNILRTFGYFMTICYIFPVLVSFTKKNLATLLEWNVCEFVHVGVTRLL